MRWSRVGEHRKLLLLSYTKRDLLPDAFSSGLLPSPSTSTFLVLVRKDCQPLSLLILDKIRTHARMRFSAPRLLVQGLG